MQISDFKKFNFKKCKNVPVVVEKTTESDSE